MHIECIPTETERVGNEFMLGPWETINNSVNIVYKCTIATCTYGNASSPKMDIHRKTYTVGFILDSGASHHIAG